MWIFSLAPTKKMHKQYPHTHTHMKQASTMCFAKISKTLTEHNCQTFVYECNDILDVLYKACQTSGCYYMNYFE